MEREQYGKKSINSPVQFKDDSTENSLDDNFEKCSDDNFEMKVVPENKKQVMSSKVCALQDRTKSYVR